MSVDVKRLRELAEAATPNKTVVEYEMPDGSWTTEYDKAKSAWPTLERFQYKAWNTLERFHAAANPQTVIALLDEIERLDSMLDDEIEDRDARLKQIDHIADALGDEGEWTNLHDRGDAAYELASSAVAEVHSLRADNERLRAERDLGDRLLGAATDEIGALKQQLAAMTKARDEACDLASKLGRGQPVEIGWSTRIAELRKVGAP